MQAILWEQDVARGINAIGNAPCIQCCADFSGLILGKIGVQGGFTQAAAPEYRHQNHSQHQGGGTSQ
jgi:hypothetical protein